MGLILSKNKETNSFLGKRYDVEYKLSNGRIKYFSNILDNVDKYFWFFSEEDGMHIIRQDRIITMVCSDSDKSIIF